MNSPLIKITPIGGLGNIGANMTLLTLPRTKILIDAGILFPNDDFFDISYLIPDLNQIEKPDHLLITHAHEDHIGAIFHVLEKFPDIQIHASPLATELIKGKLGIDRFMHLIRENSVLTFDNFEFHPIAVNHSIPETFGFLIKDAKNKLALLHLSDFKLPINMKKITELSAHCSIKILLADSTNILESKKQILQEEELLDSFDKILNEAKGRVFFTLFASNIFRLRNIILLGKKYNRKILPYGRSMINYLEVAQRLEIIEKFHIPSIEEVKPAKDNLLALLSGCQGDFKSAFRRVAFGEDSTLVPRESDTFVFSSRTIPGNEKNIISIINKLALVNCKVITTKEMPIHSTGHATPQELKVVYENFRPTNAIPIHGDSLFLQKHVEFIREFFPSVKTHLLRNFHSLIVNHDAKIDIETRPEPEHIIIHGNRIPIEREKIRERRKIACNGAIFLSVNTTTLNFETTFIGIPQGVIENQNEQFNIFVEQFLRRTNIEKKTEDLQIAIRRYFDALLGYRPVVVIQTV